MQNRIVYLVALLAFLTIGCTESAKVTEDEIIQDNISGTIPRATIIETPDLPATIGAQMSLERATQTAWAALPINMGTPTVPAPREDGLDLSRPNSWIRFTGESNISFDYLITHLPKSIEYPGTESPVSDRLKVTELDKGIDFGEPDRSIFVYSGPAERSVSDSNYWPESMGPMGPLVNWAMEIEITQSTDAWIYVIGERNQSPNPINLDFWNVGPTLEVEVFNANCLLIFDIWTPFGAPGPVVDVLGKPLDEVVAEHFPVFDHMYKSVQFPPECE